MMRKLLTIVGVIFALALTSCKKDDSFTAEVDYPEETVGRVLTVDAWKNEFPLEIKTDGHWRIEKDSRFFRVSPESGTGNTTVTVTVQDNRGEERKEGALTVVFPDHEEKNRELIIEQKYAGDYDSETALRIGTSNKIYAIGYSYDATGEWASPNSVKVEIFDTKQLSEKGKHVVGPTQASLVENIVTGSSISELTNALAVKAEIKGGFGKFKTEANASYDMNHLKNNNYEYATTYFNLDVRAASFDTDLRTLCDDYMTDDAWYAINGVPREIKRTHKKKVSYPSTKEGLKNLVKYYGTHVILTANLGGRVRYSMEADISKITSSYEVKAFAQASYEGVFVSPSGSVDEKFRISFRKNRQNVSIRLNVLGGDESKAKKLGASNGFTKANLDDWVQSVTAANMALVGFDRSSLVPLYDLVDESLTLEEDGVDGKARKEALKQYMNGGMAEDPDFSSYDCGTVTEFNLGDINFSKPNGTLVRDVILDGQYVGQICNEFIPNINRQARVTVVYPVINNVPRYNMGFFLGNASHRPARVSWDGTDVTVQEYADLDFGSVKKLYLRGASVSPTQTGGTTAIPGTVHDSYLEVFGKAYRLVKIFDHLWTGEDYQAIKQSNGLEIEKKNITVFNNKLYYHTNLGGDEKMPPSGWRFPSVNDYMSIKNKLKANGISEIGKAFISDGVLGLNIISTQGTHGPGSTSAASAYLTSSIESRGSDIYHGVAQFAKGGDIDICFLSHSVGGSIRFIKY